MTEHLPNLQQAYDLLRTQGEQFPGPRAITPLDDLTFDHPRKGAVTIGIDEAALSRQGMIYTGDPAMRSALGERNIATNDLRAVGRVIENCIQQDGRIWGFSGYATGGYSYETEAEGLSKLYEHLAENDNKPALTVDGGVSAGNLGLSGVIASMHNVPTIGMIPRQGLASVGIRDHLVVWGNTYKDREVLIGTAPDVLVCIGGGEGTQRECQAALRWGTPILLLALSEEYAPNSLPSTYKTFPEMVAAIDGETMVVCRSMDAIPQSVDIILEAGEAGNRIDRIGKLKQLLNG